MMPKSLTLLQCAGRERSSENRIKERKVMKLEANKDRMLGRINKIKSYTSEEGKITRLTYSKCWAEAVKYVRSEMEKEGMSVRMDTFGNLIGNYNPGASKEKPIGIGSHLDSVKNAGAYDGVAGIVVGLEIVSMLHENGITPRYPIEVLATADEEGAICQRGYFGGRFMTGDMSPEECLTYRNIDGKNIEDLQKDCELFKDIKFGTDAGWAKDYYKAFYEVHVEQGGVMEENGKDIGIVKGVVGIGRLFIEFTGESDHAGPTIMSVRKDAMVAASDFTLKAWEVGNMNNRKAVTTVARIENTPNIHNVIAGKTKIVCDFRSEEDDLAVAIKDELKEYALSLKDKYGVGVEIAKEIYTPRKHFSEKLVNDLRNLNMPNSMELFSWAGHDAKAFAEITDTCMVFMPSIGGKSHCPEEYTDMESFKLTCEQIINLFI